LTDGGSSWLWLVKRMLPSDAESFDALWRRHPPQLGTGRLFGQEVTFHRYQQTFGIDYAFTGQKARAAPLTEAAAPEVFHAKEALRGWLELSRRDLSGLRYEACLVNWYDGGEHWIGAHADDERGLVPKAPVFSLSWGETRAFKLAPKTAGGGLRMDLELEDGDVLVMGGECQRTHKHQIPRDTKCHGRRIGLTFRCFKAQQDATGASDTRT